jgi:hypothetical protein
MGFHSARRKFANDLKPTTKSGGAATWIERNSSEIVRVGVEHVAGMLKNPAGPPRHPSVKPLRPRLPLLIEFDLDQPIGR